jgi:hypothetical protein
LSSSIWGTANMSNISKQLCDVSAFRKEIWTNHVISGKCTPYINFRAITLMFNKMVGATVLTSHLRHIQILQATKHTARSFQLSPFCVNHSACERHLGYVARATSCPPSLPPHSRQFHLFHVSVVFHSNSPNHLKPHHDFWD